MRQGQFDLAQAQLQRARRRAQTGASPEVEVLRAEAGLAERLEAIIVAQNAVLRMQRELKRIVNLPGLTIDTPVMLEPATPPDPVRLVFDPAALADHAVANRM